MLSKDAGDDPFKRAALIKDITSSIAIIPDLITRQVYIKDTAERLHISEKTLTTEVVNLRKKKVEEINKAQTKEEVFAQPAETPQEPATPNAKSPIPSVLPASALEQNYYNLIQLIVRYGEQKMEVDGDIYTIGEVIIGTLANDGIQPPRPVYKEMIDEFNRHFQEEGFKAETFYKFHPNPQISSLAVEMIAEKYRFANSEKDLKLGELVVRLIYEIKLTVINMQIEKVDAELKDAQATGNWERQMQLLKYQPQLLEQRNMICKILGNRVISV